MEIFKGAPEQKRRSTANNLGEKNSDRNNSHKYRKKYRDFLKELREIKKKKTSRKILPETPENI